MISKNLGQIERFVRLLIAAALVFWAWRGNGSPATDAAALLAACALLWNAIFGRCYLWRWLGLNSKPGCTPATTTAPQRQNAES